MKTQTIFHQYSNTIRNLDIDSIKNVQSIPYSLRMEQDGDLSVYYIPFEYVNPLARIVLVGITPGFTQIINAMREAQRQLKSGADDLATLYAAKRTGAFSGSMRPNLVGMLDHLGVNDWLGINSSDELFGSANHLVHTTSALRHPVFLKDENYNGTPNMTKHPMLRRFLLGHFAQEVAMLKDAIYVPLGPKVSEAMSWLVKEGVIDGSRVLDGMPHPSGANAERIAYFLGKKTKNNLSVKTDPVKLDHAKAALIAKMADIRKLT